MTAKLSVKRFSQRLVKVCVNLGAMRGSKLDPFKPYIQEQMQKGVLNAVRLLRDLRAQGYTGEVTILREYMRPLRPVVKAVATVRFETDPGKQAQIDLGEFPYIGLDQKRHKAICFVMVLSYSRMLYLEYIRGSDQLSILQALRNALEYFGGVPVTILSDNCKPLVLSNDGQGNVEFTPEYLDFAKYYGFLPKACKPYRSRTKGKIERPIRYIRQSFWPVEFVDSADLNRQAFLWRDTVANARVHATTHAVPLDRFAEEKLTPLPVATYPLSQHEFRKVANDCRVSWKANFYSVPWQYVGHSVMVRELQNGVLRIEHNGQVIAEHRVLVGKHQVSHNHDHTKGIPRSDDTRVNGKVAGVQIAAQVEQRDLEFYEQIAATGVVS
ncbi:IS21 family transposase [Alicyclobacillus cycloheptanicus]|uniref:Transposase n=1 Tax=Alicyclobacillus cycloheptanicus TaxID=1457 RepID=A0ABT9XMC9_9BACL|nr:IS21 family transposase [Alicyclobacillus cycloheptanicus]MDQ0191474.1 transposase [Alicyclobacillus cycloheptanicus]